MNLNAVPMNFGYTPDHDRIKSFAANLPKTYNADIAKLVSEDDGKDVFLYRPLVYLIKQIPELAAKWLISDNGKIRLKSYNQGAVGSCHTPDTEVLTETGWKLFKDCTILDKLATVNPETQELTYEYPTTLLEYDYDGDMYYSNHSYLDFGVTSNHNMLVRKWNEGKRTLNDNYELIEAKDLGWYCGLMANVNFKGNEEYPDIYLKFLGIYVAEGCMRKEPKKSGYSIQLAAFKEREKIFIRNLLEELNITYQELKDRFTFCSKELWTNLKELGFLGIKAPFKFIPKFVFTLSSKKIEQFLIGHKMGDGCEQCGHWSHYTSSVKLANDLQRAIFLSGKQSRISTRGPRRSVMKDGRIVIGKYPEHRISSCENNQISIERKEQIKVENYKGKVYCATVPTYHTLITRRNGTILISGNCVGNAEALITSTTQAVDIIEKGHPELFKYMGSPEALYAIGREAGNMLGSGDGCYGSAMADGETTIGTLWQTKYGDIDLSDYSVSRCKQYGRSGIPSSLREEALKYKILTAYQVKSVDEAWSLIGAGYAINQCSNIGWNGSRDSEGAIRRSGSWGHSMAIIGRRTTKSGRKLFLIMNSWGDEWTNGPLFEDQPTGSFYADYQDVAIAIGQDDVFVKIDVNGVGRIIDWNNW